MTKINGESFVFVAMPFGDENLNEIYEETIRPAVEACGVKCKRADEIFDTDIIIESIENDIRDCLLVIADLTGRNVNVFYEIGYARSLDKEVVLLTQKSEDVPFDLQHRRYVKYGISRREQQTLRETLVKTLTAVIPRAQRAQETLNAQQLTASVDSEVAALRAGMEGLRYELRMATQGSMGAGDIDTPVPVFHTARLNAVKSSCQSNLKQLGLGLMQYVQDYNEKMPDCANWQEAILPYIRNSVLFKCPGAPNLEFGYAMNSALDGAFSILLEDPSRVPVFFDSALNRANAAGGLGDICDPPRHLGRNNVVFADGHVTAMLPEEITSLIWVPERAAVTSA